MKKAIIFPLFLLTITSAYSGNLSALFSYCTFNVPDASPYVEVYLHVVGTSVNFVQAESTMKKGQIEVQWTIKNGDRIVHFDKYNLNSPLINSTDSLIPDFIDQQRIKLNAGKYNLDLSIKDKNSDSAPVKMSQAITISFPADSVSLSDIELIEKYTKATTQGKLTKSGYDLVPSANSFYPKQSTELKFYVEVYNTDRVPADDYLVRYYISMFNNNKVVPNYSFNLRQKPAAINVIMGDIPINNLQSGNYNLNIEIRSKKNELVASKQVMFQRSNPQTQKQFSSEMSTVNINNTFVSNITETDSLIYLIDCLHPISSNIEMDVADLLMEQGNDSAMQKFLYYFWEKRNPENPEDGWLQYMVQVNMVDQMYAGMGRHGYETDRGRVYLQYGAPNAVSNETQDPSAYPYEIWQYYKLNTQSNRKFVFYSKDVSSNDYRLLHSDAIGELQQPQWQAMLHERSPSNQSKTGTIGIDQTQTEDIYGSHSKEKFANPH